LRNNVKALFSYFTSGSANSAVKLGTSRTIDGVSFDGSANIRHDATCSTAAATVAKTTGTITGFTLAAGASVAVMFTYGNTATSPTLNVNSTGAAALRCYGAAVTPNMIPTGWLCHVMYDGSYWQLLNPAIKSRSTTLTLSVASWSGSAAPYTYTISTTAIRITPTSFHDLKLNSLDTAVRKVAADADIVADDSLQAANTIVLKAYGTKPTVALPVILFER
jgi:hypothetical protein